MRRRFTTRTRRRGASKEQPTSRTTWAMGVVIFLVVVFLLLRQLYAAIGPQDFRRIFGLTPSDSVSQMNTPGPASRKTEELVEVVVDYQLKSKYWSHKQLRDYLCVYRNGARVDCEDADHALSNAKVDWKENALFSAERYLKYRPLSKARLYEELTSDSGSGFTAEEASYAVEQVGADWQDNALKTARKINEVSPLSDEELIQRLSDPELEAFTEEEARWALAHLDKP